MSQTKEIQRNHLEYPQKTMVEMVETTVQQYPQDPAYEFYGKKTSYAEFMRRIKRAAGAFLYAGIKKGDAVTICLPNIPQALDSFYALNWIGAVANMVHPLSAEEEITFYLDLSESKLILTLDLFYEKVYAACRAAKKDVTVLVARIQDELPKILSLVYYMKKGKEYAGFPDREGSLLWTDFLKKGDTAQEISRVPYEKDRTSVILYSGGTTGTPKGICLTDMNFNACSLQAIEAMGVSIRNGLKMLSCMPMFHGFGLCINIHVVVIHGGCCILMPTFTTESYAAAIRKKKPNFIAGVPTIFETLLHLKKMDGVNLSFLMGMFCGGDSLSVELKRNIDSFLKEHHAKIQVREGYGLTECVTASCLTPKHDYKEGSIGIPFPDTEYKIVRPGTQEYLPAGEQGEIILSGPTVMTGYLKNSKETENALRKHKDGKIWLYTGDIGKMDPDGFVYFIQRAKRIIITNGYNVYPGQLENILDGMQEVAYSCVIGVKDPKRTQRVRAYIVLKEGVQPDEITKESLLAQLRKKVAAYAIPREIIFRKELPRTLVNKVNYRKLEEETM